MAGHRRWHLFFSLLLSLSPLHACHGASHLMPQQAWLPACSAWQAGQERQHCLTFLLLPFYMPCGKTVEQDFFLFLFAFLFLFYTFLCTHTLPFALHTLPSLCTSFLFFLPCLYLPAHPPHFPYPDQWVRSEVVRSSGQIDCSLPLHSRRGAVRALCTLYSLSLLLGLFLPFLCIHLHYISIHLGTRTLFPPPFSLLSLFFLYHM